MSLNYHDAVLVRDLSKLICTPEDYDKIITAAERLHKRGPKVGPQKLPLDAAELIEIWCSVTEEMITMEKENQPPNQLRMDDFFPIDYSKSGRRSKIIAEMRRIEQEITEDPSQKYLDLRLSRLNELRIDLRIATVFEGDRLGIGCKCGDCEVNSEAKKPSTKRKLFEGSSIEPPPKKKWDIEWNAALARIEGTPIPGTTSLYSNFPKGWLLGTEEDLPPLNDIFPEDMTEKKGEEELFDFFELEKFDVLSEVNE